MGRVLHAPLNIGGHVHELFRAERALGVDSHLLLARSDARIPDVKGTLDCEAFGPGLLPWPGTWRQRRYFLDQALEQFDIFHFNFGRSLLDFPYVPGFELRDLETLREQKKKIVVTFQGCDARDKWDHLRQAWWSACPTCEVPWCGVKSIGRRRRLERVRHFADRIFVLNPDLSYRLPGAEFLPYAIGPPQTHAASADVRDPENALVTIAHAPTDRSIKGTKYLVDAVRGLQAKGLPVQLDLIEGVTHAEVLRRLRGADIAVDQLLIGWYGGFAVECMWLEKPVVCYINEVDAAGSVPDSLMTEMPLIRANPTDLQAVLLNLVLDQDLRIRCARRGLEFARRWHTPTGVAEQVIRAYRS